MKKSISVLFIALALSSAGQTCGLKVNIPCIQFCAAGTFQADSSYCTSTAVYATGASHGYAWQCSDGSQGTGTITTFFPAGPGVTTYTFFAVCETSAGPELVSASGSVTTVICSLGTPVGISEIEADSITIKPLYFDLHGNQVAPRAGQLLIEVQGNQRRKILIVE